LADSEFDNNILEAGSVIALNLKCADVNSDFRMNERIFNRLNCSEAARQQTGARVKAKTEEERLPANIQPKKNEFGARSIVHKLGPSQAVDPLALAKSNAAIKQWQCSKELKALIKAK
jgi:hypothetical protein